MSIWMLVVHIYYMNMYLYVFDTVTCQGTWYHDWRFYTIFMRISLRKRHFMYIKKLSACTAYHSECFAFHFIEFSLVGCQYVSSVADVCHRCVGILYISHAVDFSPLFQLSSLNLSFDFFLILCFFVLG